MHWRYGFARRSRVVRVDFRSNRELSSTHRKIGHFSSIKWYQLTRLIGEFYRVFSITYSPKKPKKTIHRLDLCPRNFLCPALSFNICIVEFACFRVDCCWSLCVFTAAALPLTKAHHIRFAPFLAPPTRSPPCFRLVTVLVARVSSRQPLERKKKERKKRERKKNKKRKEKKKTKEKQQGKKQKRV